MKVYNFKRTQDLPISLDEAWTFFSSPYNLARITPPHMNFKIEYISGNGKMYAGQVIRYKVAVLPFWSTQWVTEITHMQEPNFFVDEQRFGPYRWWHHQHSFHETETGVRMTDEVSYAIPLGWLGRMAHAIFVRRQLNRIFDFRYRALENKFISNRVHNPE